ncbi:biogenesis of lysosome-related organelles complex 1 subunit 1 [Magnolia sinica]|uniref:biogenesis of lysosome-related organelles complex 1 subunit 1 n=1 Tax=Magnolia sinica TaxID=86752 RepID=UPI00265A2CDF|nr:biogenesis of lysosome-related organelles complex 1 subunit 1 [Magnolia sinica]
MEKTAAAAGGEIGSLKTSLLRIVVEHHQSSLQIRHQTEKAKNDALRSAMRVSELLVNTVNSGVEESFVNEKRIELEIRALASTVMRYTKQTNQWLAASHALNTALKEIGDFENWMKTMDYDCKSINAALRNIHQT